LSRDAIPTRCLSKALPFQKTSAPPTSSNSEGGDAAQPTIAVEVVGTCTLGKSTTPMRLHPCGYFSNLLEKKREKTVNRGDKCTAKPQFYGEALTSDEVAERFAEVEAQKAASKTTKQKGI